MSTRYQLKQKLLAFGNDFSVLNEAGEEAYYFDGKVMAIGTKIIIKSPQGETVGLIRRKFFTFRPTFSVSKNGREVCRIFQKAFSFRKTFVIDVPGPDDITVVGKIFEHDYKFYLADRVVAQVSKKWFRAQDTYGVEIVPGVDKVLILSCAVIIDLLCHPKRDSSF